MIVQNLKINGILLTYISFLLLTIGCSYQPGRNEKLYEALTDTSIVMRGYIVEITDSKFRYDYYDVLEKDSFMKKLIKRGFQGGGDSWAGIVYGAIRMSDGDLLSKIRFDPESDGLAIWSNDKESLKKVGRLVAIVKTNENILEECIITAKKNGQME